MYNKQQQSSSSSSSSFVKVQVPNVVILSQRQEDVIASLIETLFAVPVVEPTTNNENDDMSLALSLDNTNSTNITTNTNTTTIGTILVNDIHYRTAIRTVITQQLTSYIRFLILLAINLLSNRFGMIIICFGKNTYIRHRHRRIRQQQRIQKELQQQQNRNSSLNDTDPKEVTSTVTVTVTATATQSISRIIHTIKSILISFYNNNTILQLIQKYVLELIVYDTIYYYFISPNKLQSFTKLSLEERIEILQYLENPNNTIFQFQNQIFHGIKRLLCTIAYTYYNTNTDTDTSTSIGNTNTYNNPLWNHIHYPGPIQQEQQQQQGQLQQEYDIDSMLSKSSPDMTDMTDMTVNNKKYDKRRQLQIQQQKQYTTDDTKYVQYATQEQQQLISQITDDTINFEQQQQHQHNLSTSSNMKNPILDDNDNDDMGSTSNDKNSNNDIEYDVIIVGSGASGSVATYVLSSMKEKLNLNIVIVEEGSYYSPNDICNIEKSSFTSMYQNNGYLTNKDSTIVILAGKTFGGGTTINWSCSIPLPLHILTEWNTILSLKDITHTDNNISNNNNQQVVFGTDYYKSLQFILQHITGTTEHEIKSAPQKYKYHNNMNQIAISGYDILQFQWIATKLNIIPKYFTAKKNSQSSSSSLLLLLTNSGGYICFGDRYGIKNGSIRSFFVPAVSRYQQQYKDRQNINNKPHQHHRLLLQLRQEIPPPIVKAGTKLLVPVPTTEDDTGPTSNNRNNNDNIRETGNNIIQKSSGSIHFLTNCKVLRVLTTTDNDSNEPYDVYPSMVRRRAIGVECQLVVHPQVNQQHQSTSTKPFTIRAKKAVVLSAGALQTPCILQRSNFQSKHIGQHLWLHPVMIPMGYTTTTTTIVQDDSTKNKSKQQRRGRRQKSTNDNNNDIVVNPFYGLPMTTACTEFHQSYRYLIECPATHPGLPAAFIPWKSPIEYWNKMSNFHKLVPLLILQRDYSSLYVTDNKNNYTGSTSSSFIKWFDKSSRRRKREEGGGSVHSNRYGELVIDYKIHPQDVHSLMHGVQMAIRVLNAAGLTTIYSSCVSDNNQYPVVNTTSTGSMSSSIRSNNQQQLKEESTSRQSVHIDDYINNTIRPIQWKQYESTIASAHQMGTCRISTVPQTGVVDYINAETWECNNLYIYDTSIFPTASGSNPMITVLTLSHMFSQRLLQRFKYQHDTNIYQQLQKQQQERQKSSSFWWRRRGRNRITTIRTANVVNKKDLLLTKQQYDVICQLEQQRIQIRKNGIPIIAKKTSIIIRTIITNIVQIIIVTLLFIIGTTTWIKYDFENKMKLIIN